MLQTIWRVDPTLLYAQLGTTLILIELGTVKRVTPDCLNASFVTPGCLQELYDGPINRLTDTTG